MKFSKLHIICDKKKFGTLCNKHGVGVSKLEKVECAECLKILKKAYFF